MTVQNDAPTVTEPTVGARHRRDPHRRRRHQGQGACSSRRAAPTWRCGSPSSPAAAPACATSSSSTTARSTVTTSSDYDGFSLVVDRMSVPYLGGATIDFVDTIEKQGFTIDNPNATGSCACGDSFN